MTEWSSGDYETHNWVDDVGGLPSFIKRISRHLKEKGMDESRAIATAVNAAKKMCSTGDTSFPGVQNINAKSRAEACKAVAEWEAKKARARADNAPDEWAVWAKDLLAKNPTVVDKLAKISKDADHG